MPTLAVVNNNIDEQSSIGSIAAWDVREALGRGWDVIAVCHDLDPDLVGSVTRVPLYIPPRVHLLQYAVGRAATRRALRGRRRDVLMVHQPQLAAIADIWNVHYLERAARQVRGPVPGYAGARVRDVLGGAVAALEDRYLRQVPESTRVLFCGESLQADFTRLYGQHCNSRVVYNPAPAAAPAVSDEDRAMRRRQLTDGWSGPVVGFLGGGDRRKGADLVRAAVEREPDLFLLHAGPTPLDLPGAAGRHRSMGNLLDVNELLDAVDVLLVPSRFEPFGLVVVEAAARGVPVAVAAGVGSAGLVLEHGAGEIWGGATPLSGLVRAMIDRRSAYAAGGLGLARALDRRVIAAERFAEITAASGGTGRR